MQNQAPHQRSWDLSQYELNRTPQEAITDDTEITVSQRTLHNELMCPICLDMLKNTMTTKECLHRFCQECITRALRNVNRECPTCRKKLVSRRSLRPDPNFDALIAKIYPSRDEYEAQQERLLMRIKEQHSANKLTASLAEGIRLQKITQPPRAVKRAGEDDDEASSAKRHRTEGGGGDGSYDFGDYAGDVENSSQLEPEVDLVLSPHPEEADQKLKKRFIKTAANATMYHIAKFVTVRTWVEAFKGGSDKTEPIPPPDDKEIHFQMFVVADSGHTPQLLDGTQSLEEVSDKYWKAVNGLKPVELFFKRIASSG